MKVPTDTSASHSSRSAGESLPSEDLNGGASSERAHALRCLDGQTLPEPLEELIEDMGFYSLVEGGLPSRFSSSSCESTMGHDQLFKEVLRAFLREFLELFFPDAAARLEFDAPVFPIVLYLKGGRTGIDIAEYRHELFGREWVRFRYASVGLA